ncbi:MULTISPECIES: hypothetical protein [unclassified Streptomyces]|uniref:hypothetical protein n=1 Tax=unclassified Streptomyces TaxID=2593676 RepID=UPI002DD9FC69|nr:MULTISPECIES: hypothetical protein [unclassified Streptomyces]WSA90686.1 hypothetical protein OIE63_03410 [Streptomyces sp. NBC_01795]WSB75011.1 hypothetical protein OHB04_03915 [Streptomyces sp. NBC_01775]WSS16710.1 hypothetical protein OG533_36000 [Streptomyces sp. NBC_01186]WSS45528.1 hypothetical protein OG220_36685 [Streptomyces sp. NBC_01187]
MKKKSAVSAVSAFGVALGGAALVITAQGSSQATPAPATKTATTSEAAAKADGDKANVKEARANDKRIAKGGERGGLHVEEFSDQNGKAASDTAFDK